MDIKVIIPARNGSKGLPGKNLKKLLDKPLIDYSILTALEIFEPNSILLTSDSELILQRGREYGLRNILRPKKFATDTSPIIDTLLHAVDYAANEFNIICEAIILLQPTFPIRSKLEIINAINFFKKNNLSSLISVRKMKENPSECISIYNKNYEDWKFLVNPNKNTNRQSYQGDHFFINGNFYISKVNILKKYKSFYFKNSYFYECEKNYNVDIDDLEDFYYAEYCLQKRKNLKNF